MTFQNPLLHLPQRPLPRVVGVVGAGAIGPDIGYYLLSDLPGLERLVLVDVSQPALDAAQKRLAGYLDKSVARGRMDPARAEALRGRVEYRRDLAAMAGADWVIESATENLALKHRIFVELEGILSPDAWITSNSSSLPAVSLFANMARPGRCTATHFFSPAWRNPVVEVARWDQADPGLVADLCWIFCATGKVPLVTADAVCLMLDRVFDNWCNEAALLLPEASSAEIDSAVADLVAAGPFFVLNMARGNPIIIAANTTQAEYEGEHYRPAPVLRSVEMWKTGKLGERIAVDPARAARIRRRLLGVVFSQSVDILDRGIGSAADLDLGCRLALGFRKGPTEWIAEEIATQGAAAAEAILAEFTAERPGMPGAARPLADYVAPFRFLVTDDVDGVRILTIRRPEALNALHDDLNDELLAAIRTGEADPAVKGFVITGYGAKAFCAGADIGRFPEMLGDAERSADYARGCSRLLVHLDAMEKPVVAALNGMALGGGLELATRCHEIVAIRGARLQFPEVNLGIAPGSGALAVPLRRWPEAAEMFADMILTARPITSEDAAARGVVSALADDQAGLLRLAVARVLARQGSVASVRNAPLAFTAHAPAPQPERFSPQIQQIIAEALTAAAAAPGWDEALEIGYRAFGATACTPAAAEGIAAFGEKRKADFTRTG